MSDRQVLICQGRTCRKYGSKKVLEAFLAESIPNTKVIGCSCLGQCGNGPMVAIEPDGVWYWQVRPQEVLVIVEQHLRSGRQLVKLLYPRFHRDRSKAKS
jgi:(2Fe-2S) ferredoxin